MIPDGKLMNATLLKALVILIPTGTLFCSSLVLFVRARTGPNFLQLLGAGGFVMVVLAHVCEALHLLPWMGWGTEHSAGHYVDLSSAVLGLILFPVGYLGMSLRTSRQPR